MKSERVNLSYKPDTQGTPQVIFRYGISFSCGQFTTRAAWIISWQNKTRVKTTGLSKCVTIAPHDWLFVDHLISEAGSDLKLTSQRLNRFPSSSLTKERFHVLTISFVSTSPTMTTIPEIQR